MKPASRREFLETSLLAACGIAGGARLQAGTAAGASILERTGVALYTVRDLMKEPGPTLEAIAKLGYRYVEGGLLPSIAPQVKAAGLQQVSAYAPTYLVTGNRQAWAGDRPLLPESYTWENAIADAKDRGLRYLVITYLQKAERGGLDVYRRVAAQLDKAGEACRKAGLTLAYHAHAFEYEPIDGVRPLDLMLKETAPAHLALELDTFWASIAGQDPAAMLKAHAGRIPLVHLKDKARDVPVQYDERSRSQGGLQGDRQRRHRLPGLLRARGAIGRPVLLRRAGPLRRQHSARQPAHELRQHPEADRRPARLGEACSPPHSSFWRPPRPPRTERRPRPCCAASSRTTSRGWPCSCVAAARRGLAQGYGVRDLRTRAAIDARTGFRLLVTRRGDRAAGPRRKAPLRRAAHRGPSRIPRLRSWRHDSPPAEPHERAAGLRAADGRGGEGRSASLVARSADPRRRGAGPAREGDRGAFRTRQPLGLQQLGLRACWA